MNLKRVMLSTLCSDAQELEFEEYARKGVTLTPELWLVKLMVGAIDSRWAAGPACQAPSLCQRRDACQLLDVQNCAPADLMSACSYDEQD